MPYQRVNRFTHERCADNLLNLPELGLDPGFEFSITNLIRGSKIGDNGLWFRRG